MAKIILNNKEYNIDDAALASISNELKNHFANVINGSGATIEFGSATYSIDSAKLSTATNNFISHLNTISGNGAEVVVNGTKYSVDSTKLSGATSALSTAFDNLSGGSTPDEPTEERLEGDGAEYYTLAPTALSFRSTAPLNELQEVQINGVTVDPSNYTLEEGSTIVTFPIDYLKTLNVGSYEVDVVSDSKSVKGGFNVKAPKLNEYGFYYNQPYYAYVNYFGSGLVIFIHNNGTLDTIFMDGRTDTCVYTVDGNNMVVTSDSLGELHCTISDNGTEIYLAELDTTFALGDGTVGADEDYLYVYKVDLGGCEVTAIDKTKSSYGDIKTGVNGYPTVALADAMFVVDVGNGIGNENMLVAPNIPNTVTTIGGAAFAGCTKLIDITIPDSVVEIGTQAFEGCINLTNITIGNSVTTIGDNAFINCVKLVEVYNRSNLNIIKGSTDYGYVAYDVLNVCTPTIGKRKVFETDDGFIFYEDEDICYLLGYKGDKTDISLPEGCNGKNYEIYNGAFYGYTSLTSVIIPDSVTKIQSSAFRYCSNITRVEIGDSVVYMNLNVFADCTNLTSVTLGTGLNAITSWCNNCINLVNVTYRGTIVQWNTITKVENWNLDIPATYVQCSDGQVALT